MLLLIKNAYLYIKDQKCFYVVNAYKMTQIREHLSKAFTTWNTVTDKMTFVTYLNITGSKQNKQKTKQKTSRYSK